MGPRISLWWLTYIDLGLKDRPITQLTINWALFGSALVIALPTVFAITPSPVQSQESEMEAPEHPTGRKASGDSS